MPKHLKLLPLTLLLANTSVAFAETELDQVVVTATRTEQPIEQVLSSVSVVTSDDIKNFNYQTLAEAISALPGVTIANTGGMGKQTSLFLRGTESNHTQVLLNGVKLATNSFGAPQLEHIPLNQIDRIELVRGPQSTLYGSESIGGTIQIFTKKGGNGLTPSISVGYGSHDTKQTDLALSGGDENSWFNIGVGYVETAGINSCDARSGSLFIGCFADEPDKDSYDNFNTSIRAGHRFANETEIEFFSLRSKGTSHYDGYYNETDYMQHTYGATIKADITDFWAVTSSLSQGRIDADNTGASATSFADNKTNNFTIQNDFSLSDTQLFSVGYEYENDEIKESSGFSLTERDNNAVFTQLVGQAGTDSDYRLALRVDDNEQFGNNTTGNIAAGTALSDSVRFTASYGTAFVAPSLIDLYSSFGANPDLKAEESNSIEFGLSGIHTHFNWAVNVYQTNIDNLIISNSSTSFVPQNISEARIRGVELIASTELMGVKLNSQLSLLDPKDRESDKVLARRAQQTFTLDAVKAFNKFTVASKLYVSGKRYDDVANTRKLDGFTTLDLVGTYSITNETYLQLKAANLFDADYETASGYNQDGANYMLSVHYQP
jgi:vitamin B12 transporter